MDLWSRRTVVGGLAALVAPTLAQGQPGAAAKTTFQIVSGKVFVPVRVNGVATEAILDSGSEVSAIDAAFARGNGLATRGRFSGQGLNGRVAGAWAADTAMSVAGVQLPAQRLAVLDLSGFARRLSRPVEAVVGRDLFEQHAVRLDFDAGELILTPPGSAAGEPSAPLTRQRGRMTAPIAIEGSPAMPALLDLGNDVALILSPSASTARWLQGRPTSTALLGGYGGSSVAQIATVRAIELGSAVLQGVPIHVARRPIGFAANLGLPALQQFNPVFDLAAGRVVLAPRAQPPGFRKDYTGLNGYIDGAVLRIIHVARASPAEAAGFHAGDLVAAIDGEPAPLANAALADAGPGRSLAFTLAGGEQRRLRLAEYY